MSIVNELDIMVMKIDDRHELKEVLRQVVKELWNLEHKCHGYSKHITDLHNTVTKDDVSVLSRTIFDHAKQIEVDFYNAKIKEEEMKMTKLEKQVHDFSLDNKDRKSRERMRYELSAVFRAMTDEIRAIRANTDYELKKLHARCQGTNERLEKVMGKKEPDMEPTERERQMARMAEYMVEAQLGLDRALGVYNQIIKKESEK